MKEFKKQKIARQRRREGPQTPKTSASTERTPKRTKNPVKEKYENICEYFENL